MPSCCASTCRGADRLEVLGDEVRSNRRSLKIRHEKMPSSRRLALNDTDKGAACVGALRSLAEFLRSPRLGQQACFTERTNRLYLKPNQRCAAYAFRGLVTGGRAPLRRAEARSGVAGASTGLAAVLLDRRSSERALVMGRVAFSRRDPLSGSLGKGFGRGLVLGERRRRCRVSTNRVTNRAGVLTSGDRAASTCTPTAAR